MSNSGDYKASKLRYGGVYSKVELNSDYVPKTPSAEAQICLNCTEKKCRPDACKRYKEEHKKLKEKL